MKAVWEVARRGNVDAVRELLDKGRDVNEKDEFDNTGLHWAASKFIQFYLLYFCSKSLVL